MTDDEVFHARMAVALTVVFCALIVACVTAVAVAVVRDTQGHAACDRYAHDLNVETRWHDGHCETLTTRGWQAPHP